MKFPKFYRKKKKKKKIIKTVIEKYSFSTFQNFKKSQYLSLFLSLYYLLSKIHDKKNSNQILLFFLFLFDNDIINILLSSIFQNFNLATLLPYLLSKIHCLESLKYFLQFNSRTKFTTHPILTVSPTLVSIL